MPGRQPAEFRARNLNTTQVGSSAICQIAPRANPMAGAWKPAGPGLLNGVARERWDTMEGKTFTVEQAASILDCTPRTVRNLLAKGCLKIPVGLGRSNESARVSEKSLFQLMFFNHV